MKYLYKILILISIFVVSITIFIVLKKEPNSNVSTSIKLQEATFPLVSIREGTNEINVLHGFADDFDINNYRESITPVNEENSIQVLVNPKDMVIKKIGFELIDIYSNEVLEDGVIQSLEKEGEQVGAKITLKTKLVENQEYSLKLMLVSDTSKKIYYMTRVKQSAEYHLSENLEFINQFHQATFDKSKFEQFVNYLEPDRSKGYNSVDRVTLNSTSDLITWSNWKVNILSDVIPIVRENNSEITAVELNYLISNRSENGEQKFKVREYYRVRYTSERMYILAFERTLESVVDISKEDFVQRKVNLGINNMDSIQLIEAENSGKIALVQQKTLWYYDSSKDKLVKVFGFFDGENNYIENGYDQHGVRILNIHEDGNIDFIVYGYMNRGIYEGRMGLLLYKYIQESNSIVEQAYIPMELSYEVIEERLGTFSYLSSLNIFYYSQNGVLYSYNLNSKVQKAITDEKVGDGFVVSTKGKCIAWQDNQSIKKSTAITILNLETEEMVEIKSDEKNNIRLLGTLDDNIIYGFVKTADIYTNKDGSIITPMFEVNFVDVRGTIVKKYKPSKGYVVNVTINNSSVELLQQEKLSDNKYQDIASEYIINRTKEENNDATIEVEKSEEMLDESILYLGDKFPIKNNPKLQSTVYVVNDTDTMVQTEEKLVENKSVKYYTYVKGHLEKSYKSAAKAIQEADQKMGVVLDSNNHLIWERGEKKSRNSINSITAKYVDGQSNSVGVALSMMLTYSKVIKTPQELSQIDTTVFEALQKNSTIEPVNLTGCTLDQVLYYVSKSRPVLAMKNTESAVVITGYDEYSISVIDPLSKSTTKLSMSKANTMFEAAGNVFISYLQ